MSIRARSLVAFLGPVCLLLALIFGDLWFDGHLDQSEAAAARINAGLSNAQVLLGQILDAETSVHGYVATNNASFLKSYYRVVSKIPDHARQFSEVASNPHAAEAIATEMRMLHNEVLLTQIGHRDDVVSRLSSAEPRASLNAVRDLIEQQIDDWGARANHQLEASRRTNDAWTAVTHALAAVTIVGLLGAIWFFAFRLTGRIEQLSRNSLKIGEDEPLGPPLPGNDEVAMLDRTLRHMAGLIAERQAALARHRLIVEIARDAIFFVDFDTMRVLEANPAACDLYGYAHEELLGLPAVLLRSPSSRGDMNAFFEGAMECGMSGEVIALRKDGSTFPIEVTARGATLEGRRVVITVGRDATLSRQARQELTSALDQAVRVSRLKSDFVATISHEIRTPMNGVIGMTDLLLQTKLDTEQREFAETVRESGAALLRIIDEILDFSKIEAGKFEIETAPFDIRRTVEAVASIVGPNAARKGIGLMTFIDYRLPALVRGDAGRIRQVLINLVGNAVKFTSHGSVTLTVEAQDGQRVQFSVVDTGIGMTPEVLSRLFTPFTQGDASTTRRFGGTGLGLSISHRLVELMGGKLDVESREGIGSRFWFSVGLPVVTEIDANVSSMSRSQLSVHQAPGEVRGQSDMPVHMHVLLAEDNAVNQRVARKQLEHIGCKVTVVPNGREAVARASEQRFDAVFMDCHMPEMDGFTAARAIREVESRNDTRTPIIALTAGAMEQDRLACLAAGMDDYLSKPIDAGALRATLLRWVSKEVELRDNHVEGRA